MEDDNYRVSSVSVSVYITSSAKNYFHKVSAVFYGTIMQGLGLFSFADCEKKRNCNLTWTGNFFLTNRDQMCIQEGSMVHSDMLL